MTSPVLGGVIFERSLKLELSIDDVKWAIVAAKKLKVKQEVSMQESMTDNFVDLAWQTITVLPRRNRLRIYVDGADKYYRLRELKRMLPGVVVKVWSFRRW